MCDDTTELENSAWLRRSGRLTRRRFGSLAVGVGLAAWWPERSLAADLAEREVTIETPAGAADGYFVHPAQGRHPAVLVWPDALGLRPAFRAMARRLAGSGYAVLVVNPYYRSARAPVLPEGATFSDPAVRETVYSLMRTLDAGTHSTDARAFVAWLDRQAEVDTGRRLGTMGYCMGGPIVMRTAAAVPDRVGAAASFHGGHLVTDEEDSPHLLAPRFRADFLIAIAENDDQREPEVKDVLRQAFADNDLRAEIEVYQGAMHGWCPPDSAVYNEVQAERAWSRLLVLFDRALKE